MYRKISTLGIVFGILFVMNAFLIFNYYRMNQKRRNIQRILSEISDTRDTDTQNQFQFSSAPFVLGAYQANVSFGDSRVSNLMSFFRKYNSPLYDYADRIVQVSDEYKFDYRLLPAIAMQESNLCKYIPDNSYNCWGWGIYGNTITKFNSYNNAIESVAKGVKTQYIDKGLVTASAIMQKYTPSSNGSWAHGVNTFLQALE